MTLPHGDANQQRHLSSYIIIFVFAVSMYFLEKLNFFIYNNFFVFYYYFNMIILKINF
jgi:hypothetical protein